MKQYYIGAIALALLVSGIWTTESQADTTRKSITPILNASAQYDSNFFKTDINEEKVYTFLVQPGIEAAIETERSHLSLYYTLDAYYYDDDLVADLDFIGHTLRFDAGTSSRSERLKFGLKNDFNRSRNPDYRDYLTNSVSRAEYGINRFKPDVEYLFGNTVLGLAYQNVQIKYENTDFILNEDSTQNWGIGDIKYNLDMRNALGVKGEYWEMDYDRQTIDYDSFQALATYSRRGSIFTLDAGAGYQKRKFDKTLNDIGLFVWQIALGGTLGGTKEGSSFSLRADSNLNVDGAANQYYTTTKLALKIEHSLKHSDLRLGLKGTIRNNDYEFTDRDDDTWGIEGSFEYPLSGWMSIFCSAGYEERDSNRILQDYDNGYGLVMFKFSKPIGSGRPVISQ